MIDYSRSLYVIDSLGDKKSGVVSSEYIRAHDNLNQLARIRRDMLMDTFDSRHKVPLWFSKTEQDPKMHLPIIDLDVPHTYVASKTEGHGHLYIHVPVVEVQYRNILLSLKEASIIGQGIMAQYNVRRATAGAIQTVDQLQAGLPIVGANYVY